jgi:hypothetical protein
MIAWFGGYPRLFGELFCAICFKVGKAFLLIGEEASSIENGRMDRGRIMYIYHGSISIIMVVADCCMQSGQLVSLDSL